MRLIIFFYLSFFLSTFLVGQTPEKETRKSYYGGVFTPKGDFRVLIVPVIFKDGCETNPKFQNNDVAIHGWQMKDGRRLPDMVDEETGECPLWIFNKPEHFETYKDSNLYNESNLFYQVSQRQFRFMGDVFKDSTGKPMVIEIEPQGGFHWSHMNRKALEEMKRVNPNFDWSPYDQRKNNPQYKFDNSINPEPDKVVDYIIFIYRYRPNWGQQPHPSMRGWPGSGGGFASPSGTQLETYNGYKFSEGFTMMWGSGVFMHELAHTLYNLPHLWGANSTVGDYFYQTNVGWGATASISMFKMFSAWESWYMGFLKPVADIKTADDLRNTNQFILRDYFSSGDALRIEIPFSGGQHLWVENHQKIHPFDEHVWAGNKIGADQVATTAAGTYIYVENVAGSQETIIGALSTACNGTKLLNAAGNYDYSYIDESPSKNAWGNEMYRFRREAANPISGTNPFHQYRDDFNKDGTISVNTNYNSARNEGAGIACEEISPDSFVNLYHNFGVYDKDKAFYYSRTPGFQPGDILDMGSNPMIINYPKYKMNEAQLEPIYLNGLKLEFFSTGVSHEIMLRVSFKETMLENNQRWAGNIILPNITADNAPDLIIQIARVLTINNSKVPNRHTKTEQGDFINPTKLTIAAGASLHLKRKSKIIVESGSSLELEKGARLELEKKARIVIKPGAKLILNGNSPILGKRARLELKGLLVE
jgi:hypothetical protein